jgi:uncharacterized membrane protein
VNPIGGADESRGSGRRILSARRALLSLAIGLTVGIPVAALGAPVLFPLVSWSVATSIVLIWVWRISWPADAARTKRLAEDEARTYSTDAFIVLAAVASLAAVFVPLARLSGSHDAVTKATVLLGLLTSTLSWALVNTVFALKYARLYYIDEDGGIDFNQSAPPTYSDFAYMAFTVGVAFTVAESAPAQSAVRRVVLGHALLSYFFTTVILAVSINLISNLAR